MHDVISKTLPVDPAERLALEDAEAFLRSQDAHRQDTAMLDRDDPKPERSRHIQAGMSLRDYIAAKAMQGILAGVHPICKDENCLESIAEAAYKQADAMLKARES